MTEDLRTRRANRAEFAFALACGAQVRPGVPAAEPRARLVDLFGVRDATEWQRVMDGLLAERGARRVDLAMELRWQATVVRTVPPDLAGWQRIIREAGDQGRLRAPWVPVLLAAAARISHYEDRFRVDGLIPLHGVVHSLRGYDWGRAIGAAHLGERAGYGDAATVERMVLRAGELCARHYMSWADLSAAFSLGALLSFAGRDFEAFYAEVVAIRHRLLTDIDGPWRTIPWLAPVGAS
ncbi:DUF1266 domain-containing protein [Actinophytocola sediminis]